MSRYRISFNRSWLLMIPTTVDVSATCEPGAP